jgi:hypothetical protein
MRATKDSVSSTHTGVQYKFGAGRLSASLYITKQGKREHSSWPGSLENCREEKQKARIYAFNICDSNATVNR